MAFGVIKAAKELNIQVPEELSVIGFDDTPISTLAPVPITTIRQKKEEISRRVFDILMEKIEGEKTENIQEFITPELIIRSSTGPAKHPRVQYAKNQAVVRT